MVLFKRKPVQYLEKPLIEDENAEVWEIPETGEIFTDYEQYLNRMDFYKQKRFICQITGHSGLDFLSALRSERTGAREVEEAFPEALKGPILRRVQFQTISRIDNLVDLIYDEFKSDYYPGEAVTVHVVTGERLAGTVRDKTRFGSKLLPDGTISPPFSRYFVSLDNRPTEEAVVDDAHIVRDRKIFTKQVLRSFIKKTVARDAWTGAPWLVKEEVAQQYHIDTRVPPHLRYENKAAERKQSQAQRKAAPDYEGMVGSFIGIGPAQKLPELKPAPKSHKSKQQQQNQPPKTKQPLFLNPAPQLPGAPPQGQYMQAPQQGPFSHAHPPQNPFQSNNFPPTGVPTFNHLNYPHQGHYGYAPLVSMPQLPPPPPPIKYPIDDLAIAPMFDIKQRPPLKFFSQDAPTPIEGHPAKDNGILMESVGPLLESWDTLNVYCEVFKLDSFTFDDFVEAMQFTSEDVECELFVEVHCAALKQLVSSDSEGGKVQIQLPEMEDDSDEDESTNDISAVQTPTPEPEQKPKGRTTRSSVQKSDVEGMESGKGKSPTAEAKHTHRASEMQAERDWIDRLKKREFKDGGWEIIMVGLLYQLSKKASFEKKVEPILQKLAPMDMEATPATARKQYACLDVNLRIRALQIVCILTAETRAIRAYMEECSEQMTTFRKEKIQFQRDRKVALEELRLLNEERKILLPANMAPSPEPQPKPYEDVKMGGVDEEPDEIEDEILETDGDTSKGRSLRRGLDRAAERARKREAQQEKKEKAEAAARVPKQSKQFIKILKDIQKKQEYIKEFEEEIAVLDNDLREADCPRTRVLGKDRFWNRYYWFERNGMPYAGLPSSSTAEAGYANGCLWVQGPDDIEREGFIDLDPMWEQEYRHRFNMTVRERKQREEGPTSVFNAHQWGYYEEPEAIEALVTWLDVRGNNENKLRKEMLVYKDKIVRNMEKRKEYLNPSEEKKDDLDGGAKRMSTRTKHHHQPVVENKSAYRCLNWHNTTAVDELGHLHIDEALYKATTTPASRKAAAAKKKEEAAEKSKKDAREKEKEVVIAEERTTRNSRNVPKDVPKGRSGKPLGRQGERYDF